MKKITTLILSSLLLIGTVACGNNAKTVLRYLVWFDQGAEIG